MFNKEQLLVLCNIIAAVESEGQTYHTREQSTGYSAFTEAYENSSIENSITISRYQFMGVEAQKLLKMIYAKDKSLFTADLVNDLNNANWNYYNVRRNSFKGQTIIKIISSEVGKECADELVGQQMQEYAQQAEKHGVTDVWAQAMCANYIHHGGLGAMTRILAKTPKPYTLDNLYNASKTDTGNQVGAYRSRQDAVYRMIKQYMPKNQTINVDSQQKEVYDINRGTTAEDILNILRGWLGLSRVTGSHKVIIDTYNSYLPHPRGYAVSYTDDYCATTVSAVFIKANAVDLIGGIECSVERIIEDCFKPINIWIEDEKIVPIAGDIICFNWGNSSVHNTGWADHIGIVEYVEGNIIHTIEGNTSGGVVARKKYAVGYSEIRGYARPKYGSNASTSVNSTEPSIKPLDPIPMPIHQTVQPSSTATPTAPTEASTGTSGAPSKERKFYGIIVADYLNIRTWPGVENPRLKSYPQLPYGTIVEVCDTLYDNDGDPWYYICINNVYGFASAEYIQKK